jgi:hypothetical protein
MPQPKPRKMRRLGGVGAGAAEAKRWKPKEASTGRATRALLERRKCLRVWGRLMGVRVI